MADELLAALCSGAGPQPESLNQQLTESRKRLSCLDDEEMRLTTAYAKQKLPQHLWEKQLERLEADRQRLLPELRRLEAEVDALMRHPTMAIEPVQITAAIHQYPEQRYFHRMPKSTFWLT